MGGSALRPLTHSSCAIPSQKTRLADHVTIFRYQGRYYKLVETKLSWTAARDECGALGGTLASIRSSRELRFVSSIAPPDGAWVGAKLSSAFADRFEWVESGVAPLDSDSSFWGLGEPNNFGDNEACVEIDRRGPSANMNDEDCFTDMPFICKFESRPAGSGDDGCASVVDADENTYVATPAIEQCVDEEDVLVSTAPVPAAGRISDSKVLCDFGQPKNIALLACCEDCVDKEGRLQPGVIAGAVIGTLGGVLCIGGVVYAIFKCCKANPGAQPKLPAPPHAANIPVVASQPKPTPQPQMTSLQMPPPYPGGHAPPMQFPAAQQTVPFATAPPLLGAPPPQPQAYKI